MPALNTRPIPLEAASDAELVAHALARDGHAFRAIMTRYNQRLYRLARGIVGRASEAEDVVQEAYVHAFRSLDSFRGESALSTWLSRIVINEALGRLRKQKREGKVTNLEAAQAEIIQFPGNASDDPERTMAQRQILHLVEEATDHLPATFRAVFVARVIEGLSMEETAELLGIKPETVKTRLYRARQMVRKELDAQIGPVLMNAFPFAGRRCDRLKDVVMQRLGLESADSGS
ncbi:RNA polymerase sigma factor [Mesorhizobium sp. 8]|uniref:RNA polymerase sigma factor n=1 Tax=Mesorhizobium sp. 8 TaxID=2584466 RepID=UPI00111F0D8F|nr:RNA polymerase sigma factor [Mesorhizobium sp. 8]QDC00515.1 RNA polymerase sigma factor [Mesorhizobium sp. 8]